MSKFLHMIACHSCAVCRLHRAHINLACAGDGHRCRPPPSLNHTNNLAHHQHSVIMLLILTQLIHPPRRRRRRRDVTAPSFILALLALVLVLLVPGASAARALRQHTDTHVSVKGYNVLENPYAVHAQAHEVRLLGGWREVRLFFHSQNFFGALANVSPPCLFTTTP
jgi:hypothetical protein